jgi:hypothetical protein
MVKLAGHLNVYAKIPYPFQATATTDTVESRSQSSDNRNCQKRINHKLDPSIFNAVTVIRGH